MGDVIANRIAEDVREGVGGGDVECGSGDDGDEFAFVVEAGDLRGKWNGDGGGGAGEGGGGFVEEDWMCGKRHVGLWED